MKADLTNLLKNLKGAIEKLDPNSQLSEDLSAAAMAAEEQLGSERLEIGLAAASGRGLEQVAEHLEGLGFEQIAFEHVALRRDARPPLGLDAWIIVAAASQLGGLAEKELLEQLGAKVAEEVIVLLRGIEKIPEDRLDDVLSFARTTFATRGVQEDRIIPVSSQEPSERELESIRETLESWTAELQELRAVALIQSFAEAREQASQQSKELRQELTTTDDPELLGQQLAEYVEAVEMLSELLKEGSVEVTERLVGRLDEQWSQWRHETTSFETHAARIEFLERRLASWSQDVMKEAAQEVVREVFEEKIPEDSTLATALRASLDAPSWSELFSPLTLDPESAPRPTRGAGSIVIRAVRVAAPVLGALLGFWRMGPRGVVLGTPMGLAVSELVEERLTVKTEGASDGNEAPLLNETSIEAELNASVARALSKLSKVFVEGADEKRIELLAKHRRATSKAELRQIKVDQMEALTEVVVAIDGLEAREEREEV